MKIRMTLVAGGLAMWLWTTAVLSVDPVVAGVTGAAVTGLIIVGLVLIGRIKQ